jgi:flavin-dependent dehydrogenase
MGLSTLLLEKERLPRDKVCSGWLMGVGALAVNREYGQVPVEILSRPTGHQGYIFHVPGAGSEKIESSSLIAWRRDLDRWLVAKAQESGVEVWEEAKLIGLEQDGRFTLRLMRRDVPTQVQARFVVGADGANSLVRKSLFPDLAVPMTQAYQEWLAVDLPVERELGHILTSPETAPFYFCAHYKGDFLVLEAGARLGEIKKLVAWGKEALARLFGFDPEAEPAGKGACVEPVLYGPLFGGTFRPALGNAILVGDAAGLIIPITGEGIGLALCSGLVAASAIKEALRKNIRAEGPYLAGIAGLVERLRGPYELVRAVRRQGEKGAQALLEANADSWQKTLEGSQGMLESIEVW